MIGSTLVRQGHRVFVLSGFCEGSDTGTVLPFRLFGRRSFCAGIMCFQGRIKYSNKLSAALRARSFFLYALFAVCLVFLKRFGLVFATSTPLFVVIPMIISRFFRGSKIIFEMRDRWPQALVALGGVSGWSARLLGALERLGAVTANVSVALAPGSAFGFMASGSALKKILICPNLICKISERPPVSVFSALKKSSNDCSFIYFGTHGVANGLASLIVVAKRANDCIGRAQFIIVGEGSQKFTLVKKAIEKNVLNISFFDPVPGCRLREFLWQADVAIHFVAREIAVEESASPNKLLEALGAGLPIVSTWRGWLSRRIEEAEAGFTVDSADLERLMFIIRKFSFEMGLLQKMGERARLLAEAEFGADNAFELCKNIDFLVLCNDV